MDKQSDEFAVEYNLERQLEAAEAKIAALAEDFEVWIHEDLNEARQALNAAKALPSGREPEIKKIFHTAHNMKGQGGTFGYDLITLIGQSLCDFIRHIPDATDAELKVIDHHLSALAMVLDKRIKGPGGPFAAKIMTKLEHLMALSR